ncbi:uncharacterized protein isoform X2 [Choristoneura fumiferana]
MLSTGALTDVTLNASGTSVKAHRLVLASCSQYFAQLFKEVEAENTLVVVLSCEATELRLLLTFMYTGEVTASKEVLPSLLRLAQTLKVSGLTDADTNPTQPAPEPEPQEPDQSPAHEKSQEHDLNETTSRIFDDLPNDKDYGINNVVRSEKDRLSKLDQIVQNLYSTHKIGSPTAGPVTPPIMPSLDPELDRKWRLNSSVCTICNKRLSNQYNLRVHMETHAGRRHACRACSHVSRSRDALRKHVAYRHAPARRDAH